MLKNKEIKFVIIIFIVLVSWLITKLDFWTIKDIQIDKNIFVSSERIINRVSTENFSDNILYYPKKKIIKKLLKEIPQLDKVMIRKNIFSKVVRITTREKESFVNIIYYPHYYVISEEGILLNVDEMGEVFDVEQELDLPILTGIDEELLSDRVSLPDEYAVLLESILKKFIKFFGKESLKLDVSSKKDIVLMTGDLFDIKIGDMSNIDYKVDVFKTLYKHIEGRKEDIMCIDVRYPEHPVVRYAK